jgi:RIO-like serine/threonine protein kinase
MSDQERNDHIGQLSPGTVRWRVLEAICELVTPTRSYVPTRQLQLVADLPYALVARGLAVLCETALVEVSPWATIEPLYRPTDAGRRRLAEGGQLTLTV